ncbi:hypothetical protein TNCT_544661 [Trichonephila clavata]|uniref:Uncharacterized protein n=1 Tax=Trichonephila clavata TaxID=2740835 RepID=A0A8X6G552_TRICU|nr:hypothetical protein TNCT_544661 [Trichonephila clavata]
MRLHFRIHPSLVVVRDYLDKEKPIPFGGRQGGVSAPFPPIPRNLGAPRRAATPPFSAPEYFFPTNVRHVRVVSGSLRFWTAELRSSRDAILGCSSTMLLRGKEEEKEGA